MIRFNRTNLLCALLCAAVFCIGITVRPVRAQELSLPEQFRLLLEPANTGKEAAKRNDATAMQTEYQEIHERWATFEDQVREQDPGLYVELEAALDGVKIAVAPGASNAADAQIAYGNLIEKFDEALVRFGENATVVHTTVATPAQMMDELDKTAQALAQGDAGQANNYLTRAVRAWPSIEGAIAAKSQSDYAAIEGDLGRAASALRAQTLDLTAATNAVANVRTRLAPYAGAQTYTVFDAAAIILREGLEALLVVVALLAFLRRSGNEDKRRWIWAGAGGGILVSIGTAFALQALFSRVSAGQNRELMEGITSLVAAALLFYVSYWLHSKSSLATWQKYINDHTAQVLARGSMLGLAFLAFLAVFREGAETTIFYIGMAPSITAGDLLIGIGAGTVALAFIAILMLAMGVRLPLRLFFRVAGLLVYYLGFKFLGTGIHALQVTGVLSSSPVKYLVEIPSLGVYPTWETLVPQLLLLISAVAVVWYVRALDRQTTTVTA